MLGLVSLLAHGSYRKEASVDTRPLYDSDYMDFKHGLYPICTYMHINIVYVGVPVRGKRTFDISRFGNKMGPSLTGSIHSVNKRTGLMCM